MSVTETTYTTRGDPDLDFHNVVGDETSSEFTDGVIRPPWYKRAFEQLTRRPPWVVITSIFFGLGWLRAAVAKLIDPAWWTGDVIETFIDEHVLMTLGWFQPILDTILLFPLPLLALIVFVAQAMVGLALITSHRPVQALAIGITLNIVFVAVGAVNPSAFYVVGQGAILLWMLAENRGDDRATVATAAGALVFALVNVFYIGTLHPAEVIDDPAIMMVTFGGLAAVGTYLAGRRQAEKQFRTTARDKV